MINDLNVDKLVRDTLLTVDVPVERLYYGGKATEYITFQLIIRRNINFADDDETAKEYVYGADIFSKGDFTTLLDRVEVALKNAGFNNIEVNAETYEETTGFYHVSIEFNFIKYLEV